MMDDRATGFIRPLAGWRAMLLGMIAGGIGSFALAPYHILPALFVAMSAAIIMLDGVATRTPNGKARWRTAFATGWSFGFGWFVAGLWWLGMAFLVEPDQFAWLLPLGVLGLPAVLAIFYGLAFALASALWSRGPARIAAFAFSLALIEWIRGQIFTGFPWNMPGMALAGSLTLAQTASLIGAYGLNVIAIFAAASPAAFLGHGSWLRRAVPLAASASVLLAMVGFGQWRLAQPTPPDRAGVVLRIMQPDVPQDAKFRPQNRDAIMARYFSVSSAPGSEKVTHYIWPESPFPFLLTRDRQALEEIAAMLKGRAVLITGAVRARAALPGEISNAYFNGIQVIGTAGQVLGHADKIHLVPFGEYLPLAHWLEAVGLRTFVPVPGVFTPGEKRIALSVPGLPDAAPLICYEAIFPGEVLPDGARPLWLLNVTNDAWFGITPGPHQHFAQARLRSIEEGLPLVRAANNGISAIVDSFGRIRTQLNLGETGIVDGPLPSAVDPPLFTQMRSFPLMLMLVLLAGIALLGRHFD
jgi:apolipoprotein N-acyltransferase